jgi:lysophospholipase L1-like esterase
MVDMIKSPTSAHYSPTTRIILISPPPINTHARRAALDERDPPLALDREFEITRAYANAVRDVAAAEGVAFVDVWTALWEAAGKDEAALAEYLGDGLHLNGNGYNASRHTLSAYSMCSYGGYTQIMYEELIKTIGKEYPEVHYENLAPVFPA